jgi:cob(I)alamin adenosyltransferase
MKIYTRTGDGGETSLFGGQRVRKTTARIRAYGTVDELNASLGVAIASGEPDELAETLRQLQQELFMVGADLATPSGTKESRTVRVSDEHIRRLESEIDRHDETLEPLKILFFPAGRNVPQHCILPARYAAGRNGRSSSWLNKRR